MVLGYDFGVSPMDNVMKAFPEVRRLHRRNAAGEGLIIVMQYSIEMRSIIEVLEERRSSL